MLNGGYEESYKSCDCFWGKKPANNVQRIPELFDNLSNLKVLDAGCGEGKNSAFIGKLGIEVYSVDISKVAIEKAKNLWKDVKCITWENHDLTKLDFHPSTFDIIISTGSLHCLSNESEITEMIQKFKIWTKPGGVNIVSSFNSRQQDLSGHNNSFSPCLLDHKAYEACYGDWKLYESSDTLLEDVHPDNNIDHMHSITRILARKP